MSDTYLIPQFIIEYLEKSRSSKSPQWLAPALIRKNLTPEIEIWFKENEVTASYIWNFFVSKGKNEFYYKTCEVCGKRIKLSTLLTAPNTKYCSNKCANSSKEVQEKKKQTTLKRFGVEYPSQSKEVQKKNKQTNLKRYGVENPLQSKEVLEKRKQSQRSNHWETFCSLLKEKGIIPLFTKEEYINDTGRKFKCLVCGKEFESEGTRNYLKEHLNKDGSYSTLNPYSIFCPHCTKAPYSKGEKEVLAFVQSIYSGTILENDRIQLEGKELDIYLPSLNLGIEFDGEYWHSKEDAKERDSVKDTLCEQKGITLLRIKDSEWSSNQQAVKEKIKTLLTRT